MLSCRPAATSAALAFALSATLALAQTPAPSTTDTVDSLAREIASLQLAQIDLDQLSAATLEQVIQARRVTDPKRVAAMREMTPIIKEEVIGMMPDITRLSSSFFTENFNIQELREIRNFNASPTGRKMAARAPEYNVRVIFAMQSITRERAPRIEQRVREELIKRGLTP